MIVNFAFRGFYYNGLLVRPGVVMVMLGIFFITSSFAKCSDPSLRAKQANLIVREIGHRLLLQSGDSTSRVMPVTEITEGIFRLEFENEFVFNHDSLVVLAENSFPITEFPSGYIVTVHDCINDEIVYGFRVNYITPNVLACRGRRQPSGCYTIEFTLPDLYENAESKKAVYENPEQKIEGQSIALNDADRANPEPAKANKKNLEQKKTDYENVDQKNADIDPLTEELKSFNAGPQEANLKPDEVKTTTFNSPLANLVYGGILVLLSVALLTGRFGKILPSMPVQNQNHATVKESAPELPALGKFLFDVKGQRLLLENEVIGLTDKECKVLELLNKSFGELIPRETLMQKIWIDEGVITGRSLDMFVSKLRKKLSSDPELRITNVHGKGYKLEISGV